MSQNDFLYDLATMAAAASPVIMVRTREPLRAETALREFAFAKSSDFYAWNRIDGTVKYPRDDFESMGEKTGEDTEGSPMAALLYAGSCANENGRVRQYHSLMLPHWEMDELRPMIQLIINYSRSFPSEGVRKTLFLIVPEGFTLPLELSDCVNIIDMEVPNVEELCGVVHQTFDNFDTDRRPGLTDEDVQALARAMAGMTRAGAEDALARSIVRISKNFPEIDVTAVQRSISTIKAEIVRKSEVLEVMQPVEMNMVGGLENLKSYISQRTRAFSPEARAFGVDRPRGIALIGPPGTGKTLCGKAVSSVLRWPLVRFDISKVFDGLVGGSEKKTAASLKMIKAMAPCVVLADEIDKVFNMNSGGGDSGVGMRVLGMILTELQESEDEIYWIMTANRTEGLPPELLRKGRLDEVFSVTVPNATERRAILSIHLQVRHQDPERITGLDLAVSRSEGYVPAEIEGAVKEAVTQAFEQGIPVTGELITKQLEGMRKLSDAFAAQFALMQEWATNNARPASAEPVAPRSRTRASPRFAPGPRQIGSIDDDQV